MLTDQQRERLSTKQWQRYREIKTRLALPVVDGDPVKTLREQIKQRGQCHVAISPQGHIGETPRDAFALLCKVAPDLVFDALKHDINVPKESITSEERDSLSDELLGLQQIANGERDPTPSERRAQDERFAKIMALTEERDALRERYRTCQPSEYPEVEKLLAENGAELKALNNSGVKSHPDADDNMRQLKQYQRPSFGEVTGESIAERQRERTGTHARQGCR